MDPSRADEATDPAAEMVDTLCALYSGEGANRLYDESVTELEHGLQSALLAEESGAPPELIAAALLHDVGHLVVGDLVGIEEELRHDAHHDRAGARLLSRWFSHHVTDPVALHVAAKRYICCAQPSYLEGLSPSSMRSLEVQGGPMTTAEALRFRQEPHWEDAVQVRLWDDRAKVEGLAVPPFDDYVPLLVSLVVGPED